MHKFKNRTLFILLALAAFALLAMAVISLSTSQTTTQESVKPASDSQYEH